MEKVPAHVHAVPRCFFTYCGQIADRTNARSPYVIEGLCQYYETECPII